MLAYEVKRLIMLRITILSFLLVEGFLTVKAQKNAGLMGQFFESDIVNNCNAIEGKERGCLDCFICDKDASNMQIRRNKTKHLIKLYDENCQRQEYCCYSQYEATARDMNICGKSEPDGHPRSRRDSLRSVLQGQYPWRVWIFSTDSTQPICAGVYINHAKRALITSATCVDMYSAEELRVGFTRHHGNISVRSDIDMIHNDFERDTRINDIAILFLSKEDALSPWAHPACLPTSSPLFATPCIAVSDEDYYLNSIIPLRESCVVDKKPLDQSLLCAVAPLKDDYIPEVGGGLFCEQATSVNNINYVVNGIYLYMNNSLAVYTNISNYIKWIESLLD